MKTLSVQQPWASLIAAGIKTVENRTWKPSQLPGRILIHASKNATPSTIEKQPLEWMQEIFNEQIFGNLPDCPDMPANAIIGYVTVERIDKENADSVWAAGPSGDPDLYYWHLSDAHLFDKPIVGVKGKLHLWDYEIDENNLPPAHKVEINHPVVDGDNITIPLSQPDWDSIHPNGSFAIEIGTLADEICLPDAYELRPFRTVTFTRNSQRRSFALRTETEAQYFTDGSEDQNPAMFPSIFNPDGTERWIAYFVWGEEI